MSAERVLIIDPYCEVCAQLEDIAGGRKGRHQCLVEMVPGADGVPWYLCVKCWIEGLSSKIVDTDGGAQASGRVVVAPPPEAVDKGKRRTRAAS
jgi:hypothetical protein